MQHRGTETLCMAYSGENTTGLTCATVAQGGTFVEGLLLAQLFSNCGHVLGTECVQLERFAPQMRLQY